MCASFLGDRRNSCVSMGEVEGIFEVYGVVRYGVVRYGGKISENELI